MPAPEPKASTPPTSSASDWRLHAQRQGDGGAYAEDAARVQTSEAALRRQSLSLAACELVQLPAQAAAAALATTCGAGQLPDDK